MVTKFRSCKHRQLEMQLDSEELHILMEMVLASLKVNLKVSNLLKNPKKKNLKDFIRTGGLKIHNPLMSMTF